MNERIRGERRQRAEPRPRFGMSALFFDAVFYH